MKHTYTVQSNCVGEWRDILSDTRDFCLGFLQARKDLAPRNAYRLLRGDGKVVLEVPACSEVSVGQVAGYPTPEQYETAANRALAMAAAIRATEARNRKY